MKKKTYRSPIMANRLIAGTKCDLSLLDEEHRDGEITGDLPVVAAGAAVVGAAATVVGAAAVAYQTWGGGCFLPGASVNTSKTSHKKIENLDIGDTVLSYDSDRKALVQNSVVGVFKTLQPRYYVVNNTLKVTEGHPFFTNGQWVKVKDLKQGDTFLDTDLREVTVHSIDVIEEPSIVHNLTVSDTHTFFVNDILVHNKEEEQEEVQQYT